MKSITMKVNGMHCKACEILIEDALKDIGVEKAKAFHKARTVEIHFDESKVSESSIMNAIKNEGYGVV